MTDLAVQEQRWMSGKQVGRATPVLKVYMREGHLERHYENKPDHEVFCYVPDLKGPNAVWWAEWVADTDFVEVPNLNNVSGENDFDQNGVEQITAEFDNVELAEQEGAGGVYHVIERGFMSPTRGDRGFNQQAAGTTNFWRRVWMNQSTQVMIVCGYGSAVFPLFCGLVDDCDLTSRPDKVTVQARSMGKVFTDQHTFMDAKNLYVKDPITFCDRQQADELTNVATNATTKSNDGSNFARFAVDGSDDTAWVSQGYDDDSGLDWIEFQVPAGRYEDFRLSPRFAGLECFVSIFATNANVEGGGPARTTDEHDVGEGWVDFEAIGTVPGNSTPYVAHYQQMSGESIHYKIRKGGGGYQIGDNSRVRLWFTSLTRVSSGKQWSYKAGVTNVEVFKRNRSEAAKNFHWILVDDVSDIVKVVCQWCGFSDLGDWEIERVGSRLKDKIVFDRNTFLIDIIKKIEEGTSYTFQVRPPRGFNQEDLSKENKANLSMGVITFRQNQAMTSQPKDKRYSVRDDQTVKGIQPAFDTSPLAQSIRTRGKLKVTQKLLENPEYVPPATGNADRFFYNYRPVWARGGNAQAGHGAAGIRRHEFHVDQTYASDQDCKVAALLIAYRMSLEAAKASVEFPLFPLIHLDSQIQVYDEGTGLSTRLWIVSRDWEYTSGEERKFMMTVGGSLLDVDIVEETRQELKQVLANEGYDPAPIARGPWEEVHFF